MNIQEVRLGTVDDYIRLQKREGVYHIKWPQDKWLLLLDFARITGTFTGKDTKNLRQFRFMNCMHEII